MFVTLWLIVFGEWMWNTRSKDALKCWQQLSLFYSSMYEKLFKITLKSHTFCTQIISYLGQTKQRRFGYAQCQWAKKPFFFRNELKVNIFRFLHFKRDFFSSMTFLWWHVFPNDCSFTPNNLEKSSFLKKCLHFLWKLAEHLKIWSQCHVDDCEIKPFSRTSPRSNRSRLSLTFAWTHK